MQTLDDVLKMALGGKDPFEIEAVLRARGDYRPNAQFGVDVHVPWSAGAKHDPSFDVPVGSGYSRTMKIGGGDAAGVGLLGAGGMGSQLGSASDRPWERVGGVGFENASETEKLSRLRLADADGTSKPRNARPDLTPGESDPSAVAEAAEKLNDEGREGVQRQRTRARGGGVRRVPALETGRRRLPRQRRRRGLQARREKALRRRRARLRARGGHRPRVRPGLGSARAGADFSSGRPERRTASISRPCGTPRPRSTGRWRWTENKPAAKTLKEVRVSLQLYED